MPSAIAIAIVLGLMSGKERKLNAVVCFRSQLATASIAFTVITAIKTYTKIKRKLAGSKFSE